MRGRKKTNENLENIENFDEAYFNDFKESVDDWDENVYKLYKYLVFNSKPERYLYMKEKWLLHTRGLPLDVCDDDAQFTYKEKIDSAMSVYYFYELGITAVYNDFELHCPVKRIALYKMSIRQIKKYFCCNSTEEILKKLGKPYKTNGRGDEFYYYSGFEIVRFNDQFFIGSFPEQCMDLVFRPKNTKDICVLELDPNQQCSDEMLGKTNK